MTYKGFTYTYWDDQDDDVCKRWHDITSPAGKTVSVDLSPYESMTPASFQVFVDFYLDHGEFPSRKTLGLSGPLYNTDMGKLFWG